MMGLKGILLLAMFSPAMAGETASSSVERIRGLSNRALCQEIHSGSASESYLLLELKIRGLMCGSLDADDWEYTPEPKSSTVSPLNGPTISATPYTTANSTPLTGTPPSPPATNTPEDRTLSVEDSVIRVSYGNTVGSGFYIDPTHVITNAHVVGDSGLVTLTRSNGAPYSGHVFYRNAAVDFAIIETETQGIPVPIRRPPKTLVKGLWPGYPQGRMTIAASTGTIRKIMDCCIIHDALIAAGSSGGPLVDQHQQVMGLNTLISKAPGDQTNSSDRGIALRLIYIREMLLGDFASKP